MVDLCPIQPLSDDLASPNLQPHLCDRERLGFGSICLPQGAGVLPGRVLEEGITAHLSQAAGIPTLPGVTPSVCFQIDQPTLGMPSREYYFKEDSNHKVSREPRGLMPDTDMHKSHALGPPRAQHSCLSTSLAS